MKNMEKEKESYFLNEKQKKQERENEKRPAKEQFPSVAIFSNVSDKVRW